MPHQVASQLLAWRPSSKASIGHFRNVWVRPLLSTDDLTEIPLREAAVGRVTLAAQREFDRRQRERGFVDSS
jgi:hypothetical protein